jgi:BirA family transcriptional regulator, biotin operon repressor / biotin---[acetyl-CoA-carboxylase] ligase
MNDIRYSLLEKLLASKDEFVSGGPIAEALGVSRVSIKNHIDQLVSKGYHITAVRNRGYRLESEPNTFHEMGFRIYWAEHLSKAHLYCYDHIDSTNIEVDRLLNNGAQTPVIVVASTQSSGKGRRGKKWISHSGENFYLSVGFRPEIDTDHLGQYTLWIGITIAEFLSKYTGLNIQVKWPNDLYLNGKKIAGILSEAKIDTDHVQHLIVGIGLNINSGMELFPDDLKNKVTSLKHELGHALPFNEIASAVTAQILTQSERYFTEPVQPQIQERWKLFDFLKGRKVVANGSLDPIEGIANGIDPNGHLLIRLANGENRAVISGEVTMAFE